MTDVTGSLRPWLRHKDWCNVKTDDPPDTKRCKCGLAASLAALDEARYGSAFEAERVDAALSWARWIVRQGRNPDPACPECGPTAWGVEPQACVPHLALARLAVSTDSHPNRQP